MLKAYKQQVRDHHPLCQDIFQDTPGPVLEAQTLQTSRGAQITVQTLDMSIPACDAIGDFLMLKNMVNDMKVAFN